MAKMQYLTPEEAIEYLGKYTPNTIRWMASTRKIPSGKMGGNIIFFSRELELWRDAGGTPEVAQEINRIREKRALDAIKRGA